MPTMHIKSDINFTLDRFCRINKKFCAPIILLSPADPGLFWLSQSLFDIIRSLPGYSDLYYYTSCIQGLSSVNQFDII